jgi:hypothetical protein
LLGSRKNILPSCPSFTQEREGNFKELVRECTSSQNVITKGRVEKFAARARAYICTYHHLEQAREVPPPAAADAVAVTSNAILP